MVVINLGPQHGVRGAKLRLKAKVRDSRSRVVCFLPDAAECSTSNCTQMSGQKMRNPRYPFSSETGIPTEGGGWDWMSTSNPSYTTRDQISTPIPSSAFSELTQSDLSTRCLRLCDGTRGLTPFAVSVYLLPQTPMGTEKQETHRKGNAFVVQ